MSRIIDQTPSKMVKFQTQRAITPRAWCDMDHYWTCKSHNGIKQCDQNSENSVQKCWNYRSDTMKNGEFSLTKSNNSWRHGTIWTIIKLKEDIMVQSNVTKSHKFLIKTIQLRERTSLVWHTDRHTAWRTDGWIGVTLNAPAIVMAGA